MLSRPAVRVWLSAVAFLVFAGLLLVLPSVLYGQSDSTATTPDKTGIFGALINHYFGAIVAAIQSGLLWLATRASPGWKKVPEALKWGILYLVGVALTFVSLKTGFGSAPIEGNALTLAAVLGSVPTLASGVIFKLGGHKVPATTSTPTA